MPIQNYKTEDTKITEEVVELQLFGLRTFQFYQLILVGLLKWDFSMKSRKYAVWIYKVGQNTLKSTGEPLGFCRGGDGRQKVKMGESREMSKDRKTR